MNKKIRVGILFGGKSAEYEVSLQSAKNVFDAIDTNLYEVSLIGIDKSGSWLLPNTSQFLLNESDPKHVALNTEGEERVALIPASGGELINLTNNTARAGVDVVFPILHGPFGEDGTVQGLLTLAGVPFVGAGVLGSAVGMDKDVMKRLLRDAGIAIGNFLVYKEGDVIDFNETVEVLGLPLFVKPANLGSSVGINKVTDKETFENAVREAFTYDTKILIEEYIEGRELQCAVLGNQEPITSVVGEIVSTEEFFTYEAKYIHKNSTSVEIPAKVSDEVSEEVKKLALKTFKTLSCEGMGRVEFFLKKDGSVLVNEINTIPGFTKKSIYPSLWAASGILYPELINRLITLAIERFEKKKNVKSTN